MMRHPAKRVEERSLSCPTAWSKLATPGELLGFERMGPLTRQAANDVAHAAQRWGQEDDITVLTVRTMPT